MENMKNGNGCGPDPTSDHAKLRKRSRRNKTKITSLVSARLNPDFDPKNVASQVSCIPNRNHEELDPKTMEFDTLAEFLHPSFIFDYLHKLLHFLKGNQKELCFPHIAPYKEAFLVKIAQDHKHLRSRVFNEASAVVARQIIEVLERNKRAYKWIHAYEDGLLNKNVLVYKKLNINKEQSEQFKVPSSGTSLASNLEDMSLSSQDRQGISSSFKLSTLNTTLKFIKDDTQLNLEYPTMSFEHAQFVYSLIDQGNAGDGDVGFGFKSLYAPLADVMKNLKEKFEFKISFVETIDRLAVRILLQKVPKTMDTESVAIGEKQNDLNSSNASASTTSSDSKHLSKAQKDLMTKQHLIESLPQDFLKDALQKLVDFLEDPRSASLPFKNVQESAGKFLETVTAISRTTELYRCFSEDCVVLLARMVRANCREPWKLRLIMGKLSKTGLRTITFVKTPTFSAKYHEHVKKNGEDNKSSDNEIFKESPRKTSKAERIVRPRSVSSDPKNRSKISITFQSAGTQVIDNTGEQPNGDVTAGDVTDGGGRKWAVGRKGKLLEAMSTPLESDRAERMMRRMGWDGGALGARGEGIIEPIIPALHLAPGAGLGHIKPTQTPKKDKISASAFRLKILEGLLSFIKSPSSDATVPLSNPLNKKESKFIKTAEAAVNNRKGLGLSGLDEVALVDQIMEEMIKDLHLQIGFQIGDDKKELHLKKVKNASLKISKKKKKRSKLEMFIESENYDHSTDLISNIEHNCATTRAAKSLAYRITFLEKIKNFLTLEETTAEYRFESVLNTKQRNFIQTVINDLNKRVSKSKRGEIENKLYDEIRRIAGDCYLSVAFSGQKITLQKKYYRKRFTNSALSDLPAPKSLDAKNTIIYKNNVVIRQGDAPNQDFDTKIDNTIHSDENIISSGDNILNRDNDSDDDILIISDNNDIISLSGDDAVEPNDTKETDKKIILDEDCMETDNDAVKDSISLDISNESLTLNIFDEENASSEILVTDPQLESDRKDIIENSLVKAEVNNNHGVIKDRNEEMISLKDLIFKMESGDNSDLENGDIDFSFTSSKRSRSDSTSSHLMPKKCKYEKYISIISEDNKEITLDLVKTVQTLISNSINETFLPLLKCHGVKNGGLIYSCHSEKSFHWVKKVVGDTSVKVVDTDYIDWKIRKMTMKINSYIRVNVQKVFSRLEMYNPKLKTSGWIVISENIQENFALYTIGLDKHSYSYICENCFSLYAGIDKVQFSVIWQ